MQLPAPVAADLSPYSDSEECRAEEQLRHSNDSDTEDSLDLEKELSLTEDTGELGQSAASSAAAASEGKI